ncbi:hypothetical protein RCC89_20575 [Cytophagaceae bacterium ABcell3]|nr:hypothetical protein RCC89_20575 [Cytophagaceae bacterium ABcell3]
MSNILYLFSRKIALVAILAGSPFLGISQDIMKALDSRAEIKPKSNVIDWVKALPIELTRYDYTETSFVSTDKGLIQEGHPDSWLVQVADLDTSNGYIRANGYLPGVGDYTPEEQFKVFRKASGDHILAFNYIDKNSPQQNSLNFYKALKGKVYELPHSQVLPEVDIYDFITSEDYNDLQKHFKNAGDIINELLVFYYLPRQGTAIQAGLYYSLSSENKDFMGSLSELIKDKWEVDGFVVYGKVELKWNSKTEKFEK